MITLNLLLEKVKVCDQKITDIKIDLADGEKYTLTDEMYEGLISSFQEVTQELQSIKEIVLVLDEGLKFPK